MSEVKPRLQEGHLGSAAHVRAHRFAQPTQMPEEQYGHATRFFKEAVYVSRHIPQLESMLGLFFL